MTPVLPYAEALAELKALCGEAVHQQLLAGGEWGLDDATLKRWLVARKGDVRAAAKDLTAHAAWRVAYVPKGRIHESEVRADLDQNKAFLPGYDRDGRPLCVVVVSRHQMKDSDMSKRCIAYALDCAALMGMRGPAGADWDGKMSGVFDLRGLKASNCDYATLKNVFDLLQNHYPERLHKLWLYCAPVVFYGLWKLVAPFIDPVTRAKVQFVYEKEAEADFSQAFDPSVLPPEIQPHGTGSWVTVEQRFALLLGSAPAPANGGPTQQQQQQQHQEQQQQQHASGNGQAAAEGAEQAGREGREEDAAPPAAEVSLGSGAAAHDPKHRAAGGQTLEHMAAPPVAVEA